MLESTKKCQQQKGAPIVWGTTWLWESSHRCSRISCPVFISPRVNLKSSFLSIVSQDPIQRGNHSSYFNQGQLHGQVTNAPTQSPHSSVTHIGVQCSVVTILKCLITLSLNFCFVNDIQWIQSKFQGLRVSAHTWSHILPPPQPDTALPTGPVSLRSSQCPQANSWRGL